MAIAELVYRINPPTGVGVDEVRDRLVPAAQSMLKNKWIKGMSLDVEEDHLLFMITMKGHDQWWIKRRAPYLLVSILTRAGLHARYSRLVEMRRLPNLKSARFWTKGHKKGSRVFMPVDGSEPPPKPDPNCQKCQEPAQIIESRSGWHQTYRGQGR